MTKNITIILLSNKKEDISTIYSNGYNGKKYYFNVIESNEQSFKKDLNVNRTVDCIVSIGDFSNYEFLNKYPFEIRKRWVHFDTFDSVKITNAATATFLYNNGRKDTEPLFSIFTCAYKTPKSQIDRLYNSLKNQSYNNWNWWIIEDSPSYLVSNFENLKDPRITIIKNSTNHGSIGFNKHNIAMCCDGDYLVEVDHDDELTPDCLEMLLNAFKTYPDCKFVYSDCIEFQNGRIIVYDKGFSCGQGTYRDEIVNGIEYKNVPISCPSINARSIRSILAQPNHVRCWEKKFYHSIGGHYQELSVCDDMDILCRTFLNTRMCHINKVLYLQHEDGKEMENGRSETGQGSRFDEIQRTNWLLYTKYDKDIHNRIVELGFEDNAWNSEKGYSIIDESKFKPIDYGYQYDDKILFVTGNQGIDYLHDCAFIGLVKLYGDNIIDSKYLSYLSPISDEERLEMYGKGFTVTNNLKNREYIDRTNIEDKIKNHYFSKIIYGSIWRCSDYIDLVEENYSIGDIIVLDGEDEKEIYGSLNENSLYFKREYDGMTKCFPISFAIPYDKIVKNVEDIKKTLFLSNEKPNFIVNGGYQYDNENDYYDNYQRSYFAETRCKSGWDCLRHYEIIGNYCLPYFIDFENKPDTIMTNWPNELQIEANKLYNNFDETEYYICLNKFFEYAKENLTCESLAKYILSKR